MDKRLAVNRNNWNERTPIHAASAFYDVASFKKGRITLSHIERTEIGDVSGKALLHLQCHFGMDTMSWSRLGAIATGVDFSDTSIDIARTLNDEIGANARFILSNVYDLPEVLDEDFDVVFTSIGVLSWLPDLDRWASVIHHFLRPGGTFYILEKHPFMGMLRESETGDIRPASDYFSHEQFFKGNSPTYTDGEQIASPMYEWQHSLGETVTSLARAGLTIQYLHEFPISAYRVFPSMTRHDDGWWRFPQHNDLFPQLFSIKAVK